jgi:U3 small nucleolar RNA-associated protein 21
MAMDGDAVWAASGLNVIKYLRGKEVCCLSLHCFISSTQFLPFGKVGRVSSPFGSNLASIIVFGSQLLGLTEDGGRMLVWGTAAGGKHCDPSVCINQLTISHYDGRLTVNDPIRSRILSNAYSASRDIPQQSSSSKHPRGHAALEYPYPVSRLTSVL